MKKLILILSLYIPALALAQKEVEAVNKPILDVTTTSLSGETSLPACILELCHPAKTSFKSKVIIDRTMIYQRDLTLKNGKKLYALKAKASIGCNYNVPESIKYYDEYCTHVATFFSNFPRKNSKENFIADGYLREDFPEGLKGNYVNNSTQEKTNLSIHTNNLFAVEKSFKVIRVIDSIFYFKKGDGIRISTQSGLKHYRDNKLLNTYKIIPQIVKTKLVDKPQIVYYMDAIQRFIVIEGGNFLISSENSESSNSPTIPILIQWREAFELVAQ